MQYRKKPVVIEAEQFTGGDIGPLISSAIESADAYIEANGALIIRTLEGNMLANDGDWIIKGLKGEFYPCKPDIFAATYDEVRHDRLPFSHALESLKRGCRIARAGWNGKGMFLFLVKGSIDHTLLGFAPGEEPAPDHPSTMDGISIGLFSCHGDTGTVTRLPCIGMKTASGATLHGWLASQSDMLARDWQILAGEDA